MKLRFTLLGLLVAPLVATAVPVAASAAPATDAEIAAEYAAPRATDGTRYANTEYPWYNYAPFTYINDPSDPTAILPHDDPAYDPMRGAHGFTAFAYYTHANREHAIGFVKLTSIDPDDPSSGYQVPAFEFDIRGSERYNYATSQWFYPGDTGYGSASSPLGVSSTVMLLPDQQAAHVTYVDETTGETLGIVTLLANSLFTSTYDPADQIARYESRGYELVSSDFQVGFRYDDTDNGNASYDNYRNRTFDADPDTSPQEFTIVLRHATEEAPVAKDVDRVIRYVDESGNPVAEDGEQRVTLTGTRSVDKVTGVETTTWTAVTLPAVASPEVAGMVADRETVAEQEVDGTVDHFEETVVYRRPAAPSERSVTPGKTGASKTGGASPRRAALPRTGDSSLAAGVASAAGGLVAGAAALRRRRHNI